MNGETLYYWIVGTLVVVTVGYYWVVTGFLVVATVERILASGVRLSPGRKVIAYAWYARGLIGDAIYNTWWGTISFTELPKWKHGEFMYSSRIQRHIDNSSGSDLRRAIDEADFLNAAVPDHIKRIEQARIRLQDE